MDISKMDKKALFDKLERQEKLMATPIDFDQLERDGLLKRVRKGGVTFDVPNIHLLPEHVRVHILAAGDGPNGARVKFSKKAPSK